MVNCFPIRKSLCPQSGRKSNNDMTRKGNASIIENPLLKFLLLKEPEKTISKSGIKFRKKIFPVIAYVGKKLYGLDLTVVENNPIPNDCPVIFACTHGFKEDVLASMLTVDEDMYVLFGNRRQALGCIDGFCVYVTGMILVDRFDKESRKASRDKIKYALSQGAKVAIFPEGTWNNSPNKIVLELYPGIWEIAKEANAVIVPIGTLKDEGRIFSSVGEAISPNGISEREGIIILRDTLATLKWNLMERASSFPSTFVPHGDEGLDYWKSVIDKEIDSVKYYDRYIEERCVYRST